MLPACESPLKAFGAMGSSVKKLLRCISNALKRLLFLRKALRRGNLKRGPAAWNGMTWLRVLSSTLLRHWISAC